MNFLISSIWTLITVIISGTAGVFISIWYDGRKAKRQMKIDTLKKIAGHRYNVSSKGFTTALNEIFVIFQDSEPVLRKLREFHDTVILGEKKLIDDKLISLFEEMCKDLKIDANKYERSLFTKVFNPTNTTNE